MVALFGFILFVGGGFLAYAMVANIMAWNKGEVGGYVVGLVAALLVMLLGYGCTAV